MQQLFRWFVFINRPNMFQVTDSPILRSTFWLYIQLLVQCTDTAADQCHSWDGTSILMWANLSHETCWAHLKKINKRKSCCILLVVYIVVLMMHGHTDIKFNNRHCCDCVRAPYLLTLWHWNFFFLILENTVYKMWIKQEPKMVALWNKRHFEEKKTESVQHV